MDAIRPPYFFTNYLGINAGSYTIQSFPALATRVARHYGQIAGSNDCAALYLRADFLTKLRAAEIPLASTVPQLVDSSVTEKCGDWWAPDAAHAGATLTLPHPERLAELWVLTSRGGPARDRGTTRIRITFVGLQGDTHMMVAQLPDYPRWLVVPGDGSTPVKAIILDTLGFIGKGPALNEVKAFRKTSS